ncbi:MAG: PKD domain-containing protein, partial [Bacteroidales bacterium]|nr:PKD domain-containing protein [Bacteroidales bacterium]
DAWDGETGTNATSAVPFPTGTYTAGTSTTVSTPIITPGSGDYFAPIDVSMTCGTSGASIYYTTDGSDPDESSTLYTSSFSVSTTTTVKARAYKTGMTESMIATNNYNFPSITNISNIASLRSQTVGGGDYYLLTGEAVLTYQQSYRGQKYIQDATAGILIDDDGSEITTTYNIYDGITGISGTLTEYGGMLQFVPSGDPGSASSTGNTITPEVVTLAQVTSSFENYEAELIKVEGAVFSDAGGTFENGTVYVITDGSKSVYNFRTTFYDVDYITTTIPSGPQDLVLLPHSRTDGEFVVSRSLADINPASSANPAVKLDITSINGGNPVYENQAFTVMVQSQDVDGVPASVTSDVNVTLSVGTGSGNLSGTITGTIASGANTITISGTLYDTPETGVVLNVNDDASNLTAGNSDPFEVIEVIIADLVISEIMYHAMPGDDTLEYFEIYNNGSSTINLLNYEVTQGVALTFPTHNLAAGDYVLVAKSADAIQTAFGLSSIEWNSGGGLSNSGEDIEIQDDNGTVVAYVDYFTADPWPLDEVGHSIRFCDPNQANNVPANWSSSIEFLANIGGQDIFGTPLDGCGAAPLIADFEADNTSIMAGESVNFTDLSVGVPTGWSWTFTGGTPASSATQNPSNIVYNTPGDYNVSLTITRGGDSDTETKTAYIHVGDPTVPPIADFEADVTTIFVGQSIHYTDLSQNTPTSYSWTFDGGTPSSSSTQNPTIVYNTAGTFDVTLFVENSAGDDELTRIDYITVLPASVGDLVITEIMYNPPEAGDDSLEYIEIYNNSDDVVNLTSYTFSFGVVYVFPDVDLGTGDYMVIAKDSMAMLETLGVTAYEWDDGSLSNGGELIKLSSPMGITIDSVPYSDVAPWPEEADGNGPSITICDPETENSVGDTWHASVNFLAENSANDPIYGSPGMAPAPVSNFTADDLFPSVGGQVQFSELASCNADSYSWEFDGGTPATSSDPDPLITYASAGDFDVSLTVTNSTGSHTYTITEYIHVGVGTVEQALENISVSPNPSNGYYRIHNPNQEEITITIYSILGELIMERSAINGDETIDLLNEQDGIYLLQIMIDGQRKSMRIIKQ